MYLPSLVDERSLKDFFILNEGSVIVVNALTTKAKLVKTILEQVVRLRSYDGFRVDVTVWLLLDASELAQIQRAKKQLGTKEAAK